MFPQIDQPAQAEQRERHWQAVEQAAKQQQQQHSAGSSNGAGEGSTAPGAGLRLNAGR